MLASEKRHRLIWDVPFQKQSDLDWKKIASLSRFGAFKIDFSLANGLINEKKNIEDNFLLTLLKKTRRILLKRIIDDSLVCFRYSGCVAGEEILYFARCHSGSILINLMNCADLEKISFNFPGEIFIDFRGQKLCRKELENICYFCTGFLCHTLQEIHFLRDIRIWRKGKNDGKIPLQNRDGKNPVLMAPINYGHCSIFTDVLMKIEETMQAGADRIILDFRMFKDDVQSIAAARARIYNSLRTNG